LDRDERSIARLGQFFGGWRIADIDALAVEKYRAARAGNMVRQTDRDEHGRIVRDKHGDPKMALMPTKPATINRELACLRAMLRKAVEWGKLATYKLPSKLLARETEFHPHIFTADEIRRLLDAAESRWLRPAIVVYINTGLRKQELLKLRRTDTDFDRRVLTVRAERAKNGHARTVPMNDAVVAALSSMPGTVYFFETRPGVPKYDLIQSFRRACDRAGIAGRTRIHDLRDTFATMALRAGVDLKTVAAIIGDSAEMCLRRYCHTDPATMAAAVERVGDIWAVPKGQKLRTAPSGSPELRAN